MTSTRLSTRIFRPASAFAVLIPASIVLFTKGWSGARPYTPAPPPLQVTVSVSVSSAGGGKLAYQWRSTDGTIVNVNAASTTWTLPDGPGIHFAYVLVSNGKGGFTERRVLLNTDTIGNPPTLPPPTVLSPPPSAVPTGNFYRSVIEWGSVSAVNHGVRMPNIPEYVEDSTSKHYPPTGKVSAFSWLAKSLPSHTSPRNARSMASLLPIAPATVPRLFHRCHQTLPSPIMCMARL